MNTPTPKKPKPTWQRKIDALYAEEKSKAKHAEDTGKTDRERRTLKRYQRDFACHICMHQGQMKLDQKSVALEDENARFVGERDRGHEHDPSYRPVYYAQQALGAIKPNGLEKCGWCHQWTCTEKHLYRGICSKCLVHPPFAIKLMRWLGRKYLDEKEIHRRVPKHPIHLSRGCNIAFTR